jgi:serine acetyltransferase
MKHKVQEDIIHWFGKLGRSPKTSFFSLFFLLAKSKTFRNLFYLRVTKIPKIFKLLYPQYEGLIIQKDTILEGGSLYFYHPYNTIINAKYIGRNCIVRHLTTIGNKGENNNDKPTILNNVDIGASVIIIGNIVIGNNVIIGAGAVVTKTVPDNCIVAGNPAKIIREI